MRSLTASQHALPHGGLIDITVPCGIGVCIRAERTDGEIGEWSNRNERVCRTIDDAVVDANVDRIGRGIMPGAHPVPRIDGWNDGRCNDYCGAASKIKPAGAWLQI